MPEYEFSFKRIFQDSIITRNNTVWRKPVFGRSMCSDLQAKTDE